MNRIGFLIFLFMFVFRLYSLEELQVHLQSSFMPTANSYDFVKGDSTGLLHFYTAEIETDSVWISVFTCDSEGNYSEKISINSLLYPTVSGSEGTLINMEFKYNKLYTHVLHDSTLLVLINHSDGNVDNHIIYTNGQQFEYNINDSFENYYLFNETSIFTNKRNKVFKIDLTTNSFETFFQNTNDCAYLQFPFKDDFIIFKDLYNYYSFYINNFNEIFPLSEEYTNWFFESDAKVGNSYFPTIMNNTYTYDEIYGYFFIHNNNLQFSLIDDSISGSCVEKDLKVTPIINNKYICKYTIYDPININIINQIFATFEIVNNQKTYFPGFPNLEYLSDPISLHRINDQAIIALSGDSNGPINFTVVDLDREQLYTQSFNVGLVNEYNYSIIPAGEYFYMFKENVIYSFKLETVLNNDINDTPELIQLSCYPNPFKDQLKIRIKDNVQQRSSINIFDIKGRKIKTLLSNQSLSKNQEIVWDGFNDQNDKVPSGIYFIKIENDIMQQCKKVLLLK